MKNVYLNEFPEIFFHYFQIRSILHNFIFKNIPLVNISECNHMIHLAIRELTNGHSRMDQLPFANGQMAIRNGRMANFHQILCCWTTHIIISKFKISKKLSFFKCLLNMSLIFHNNVGNFVIHKYSQIRNTNLPLSICMYARRRKTF